MSCRLGCGVREQRDALAVSRKRGFGVGRGFEIALPFALVWRKDNASPLLAKLVADVRFLPQVTEHSNG